MSEAKKELIDELIGDLKDIQHDIITDEFDTFQLRTMLEEANSPEEVKEIMDAVATYLKKRTEQIQIWTSNYTNALTKRTVQQWEKYVN